MAADPVLVLSVIRISISLLAAVVTVSLYKLFKGGVMSSAWPIFAIAAIFQALAGVGEMIEELLMNEFVGHSLERLSDVVSVLMFLWFTLKLRNAWSKIGKVS